MATLQDIDVRRSCFFTGYRTVVSDDHELVSMASKHKNERLRLVSSPVTEEIILEAVETTLLLSVISGSEWRMRFERDLQSLCAKNDGDLLTTSISISDFIKFINETKNETSIPLRKLLNKLESETAHWDGLGVEDVYFDGYVR